MPQILEVGSSVGDYILAEKIGDGGTAAVFSAIHMMGEERVIIKCVPFLSTILENEYQREITALQKFTKVPQIIKLIDNFTSASHGFIVLEKKKMDLLDFIEKNPPEIGNVRKIFSQICIAVESLHRSNIAHLDIKPENIFLNDTNSVVLGDFGSAFLFSEIEPKKFGACGTSYYCAPEAKQKKTYCPMKADIWSLGVLLHVLLTGFWPFAAPSQKKLSKNVKNGKVKICEDNIPSNDHDVLSLLEKMLAPKPKDRLSIIEVLSHPFVIFDKNVTLSPVKMHRVRSKLRDRACSQPTAMPDEWDIDDQDVQPQNELIDNTAETVVQLRIKKKHHRKEVKSWGGKQFLDLFSRKKP